MLKPFYLIFGIALVLGGLFLSYRRMSGIDGENTNFSIALCFIVGILCFIMYAFIDKLMNRE